MHCMTRQPRIQPYKDQCLLRALQFKTYGWLLLSNVFFLTSCAPIENIIDLSPRVALSADCHVDFYPFDERLVSDNKALKVIQLGDHGLAEFCTEVQVKQRLRRAACAVGGNSVVIVEQRGPDLWSRCYQATAHVMWLDNHTN